MSLQYLFGTPLITERPNIDRAVLKSAILKRQAEDPGLIVSNIQGWHSDFGLFDWGGEPARELASVVAKVATQQTHSTKGEMRWNVEGWANVHAKGGLNEVHAHPGNFWSAVYYVEAEGEGGELILHDPRMPALKMHAPHLSFDAKWPESAAKISPESGKLLIFPSWLMHSVLPWNGDSLRISIALNLAAQLR